MTTVRSERAFSVYNFSFYNINSAESYDGDSREFVVDYGGGGADHFHGKSFKYDDHGYPKSGTVTGYEYILNGKVIYQIDGFSIDAKAIIKAASTVGTSDDVAIFTQIFAGGDDLKGSRFQDDLYGFGGKDRIEGGKGDDLLAGGSAGDTFVFAKGFGKDTILDFGDGADVIDLGGYKGIDGFADVSDLISQKGKNVLIDFGADEILLRNADADDIGKRDFDF